MVFHEDFLATYTDSTGPPPTGAKLMASRVVDSPRSLMIRKWYHEDAEMDCKHKSHEANCP